jgi:hypothetical protein
MFPQYTYEQRWVARVASVLLAVPFLVLTYGLGYVVGELMGLSPTHYGTLAVLILTAYLSGLSLVSWFQGFKR